MTLEDHKIPPQRHRDRIIIRSWEHVLDVHMLFVQKWNINIVTPLIADLQATYIILGSLLSSEHLTSVGIY